MGDKQGFQLSGGAAATYEKISVPLWMGRWADALLQRVAIQSGEVVLDVACGTGVTTRLAERDVGERRQVTGLDINPAMLSIARGLADALPITWIEGDVSATALAPNTFNAIICQHGYHYFPDKPGALAELFRVLAPKGRLAMSIRAGPSAYTAALCSALEEHIAPEITNIQRRRRITPSAEELIGDLQNAGYGDVSVDRQTLEIRVPAAREFVPLHLGSMPIAAAFDALTDAKKDRFVRDIETTMKKFARDGQMLYPDAVNVVLGCK